MASETKTDVQVASDSGYVRKGLETKCGARTRRGSKCTRPAGWGTDHVGDGPCKLHGGNTRNHILASARRQAAVMGVPIEVSAIEALLHCVQTAAGEVHYCTLKIAELEESDAVDHPLTLTEEEGSGGEDGSWAKEKSVKHPVDLNIWIKARHEAMDRLARYSKMALDAGVDERRVRLAEQTALLLAPAIKKLLDALGLTAKQKEKAPELLRQALVNLEGSAQEVIDG